MARIRPDFWFDLKRPRVVGVGSAADHIRRGDADLMLAGGGDAAVIPSGIGGFIACKALSKRNDEPEKASRPWDKGRDGFVMGEGAGAFSPLVTGHLPTESTFSMRWEGMLLLEPL